MLIRSLESIIAQFAQMEIFGFIASFTAAQIWDLKCIEKEVEITTRKSTQNKWIKFQPQNWSEKLNACCENGKLFTTLLSMKLTTLLNMKLTTWNVIGSHIILATIINYSRFNQEAINVMNTKKLSRELPVISQAASWKLQHCRAQKNSQEVLQQTLSALIYLQ